MKSPLKVQKVPPQAPLRAPLPASARTKKPPTILAIETSCDESAVALAKGGEITGNLVLSQNVHGIYGGVVPELASRAHDKHLHILVDKLLSENGVTSRDLDAVAFTQGPGLLGSLLVGCSWTKAFAWAHNLPLIAVDHLHAHVLSHFLEAPVPTFPFLALLASGGHTQLLHVRNPFDMTCIGETLDDAVGEAFDKAAKMLGLPYPGGPALDKVARTGDPQAFSFPKPIVPHLNYSFSGLKTAFMHFLTENKRKAPDFVQKRLPDLCASIERALIETLLDKLLLAQAQTGLQTVGIAGGTAANTRLRARLQEESERRHWKLFIPAAHYCTDNAAMVACAAQYLYASDRFSELSIVPYSRAAAPSNPIKDGK